MIPAEIRITSSAIERRDIRRLLTAYTEVDGDGPKYRTRPRLQRVSEPFQAVGAPAAAGQPSLPRRDAVHHHPPGVRTVVPIDDSRSGSGVSPFESRRRSRKRTIDPASDINRATFHSKAERP